MYKRFYHTSYNNNSFDAPMDNSQPTFDDYLNRLVSEHLTTSACFLIQFEDETEMLLTMPQSSLVRDIYTELDNRLPDSTVSKGLYIDYGRKTYIPSCNETLQSLVSHYGMKPVSPAGYAFPVFRLYILQSIQQKTNMRKTKKYSTNLAINGKTIHPSFGFY